MKFLKLLDRKAHLREEGESLLVSPLRHPISNVPNVNLKKPALRILFDIDIYGKMGIDISHLILEALRNADNQVVDEGFDGSERCNILAGTMMQFDIDDVFRRMGEADRKMSQVLRKLA